MKLHGGFFPCRPVLGSVVFRKATCGPSVCVQRTYFTAAYNCGPRTLNLDDDADRLRRAWLHGLSQDEEERGGVVNRGARDEQSSAIRRLHSANALEQHAS